jgi:hypothetical protein
MTDYKTITIPIYDIYRVCDVDALKRENETLRLRLADCIHENAELHELLYREGVRYV